MIGNSNLPAEQVISAFSFHNNSIRCILINGEPWFLANDVCHVLGYKSLRDALKRHTSPLSHNSCDRRSSIVEDQEHATKDSWNLSIL